MKKRILSLLLALLLCVTMVPEMNVSAAETKASDQSTQNYSAWVVNDLLTGESYDIYPFEWGSMNITAPITEDQLLNLLAGVRRKLVYTEEVTKNTNPVYELSDSMSVEKVLKAFYNLITTLEFSKNLGTKGKTAVSYMKDNGIYTGKNGELALKDKCSIEQACVIATRLVTCVYDKLDAASKGFLWQAKANGNTVYMLGSIHMANSKIYPFSKKILDAYQSSDVLVEELNAIDPSGETELTSLGVYTDGTTLKDHLSDAAYKKVVAFMKNYGASESDIAMYKPWLLYIVLSNLALTGTGSGAQAASANLGIDINFAMNAYFTGKPVLEAEGYEYQGKMLDSFSSGLQELLLNGIIDEITNDQSGTNETTEMLDKMLYYWHTGDLEGFQKDFVLTDLAPSEVSSSEKALEEEYMTKMFTQRNTGMADYIDKLLKSEGGKTYFVVLGSYHYMGNHSVLEQLEEKGYEINRIN